MECLSPGPCWDHQPTSGGHSLAPGRGGPQTEETEAKEREKERERAKEGSGLMHVESTLRQIGLLRQKEPVDKRGVSLKHACVCVCASLSVTSKIGASSRFKQ